MLAQNPSPVPLHHWGFNHWNNITGNIYFVLHIFSGKPNGKYYLKVLKGWFTLTRFWLRKWTHVNFNQVNKIEARNKVLRLNVRLIEVLLFRLSATFYTLLLLNWVLIGERKSYAHMHGKITRQWKSSLTLITIVSALTPIYGNILCQNHMVSKVVLGVGI